MLDRVVLLAFAFGNLAMLGWLAAAAAPLLIHLWSRHRFREAPWAAMDFLLAAMKKNARRLQLQQWLLLALRTLLIALIVVAVAEPYGEQWVAGGASPTVHKVIVIDSSFSMAYRDDNTTRFSRAKQFAADLVRDSPAGDTFTVILMSSPARQLLGCETVDHGVVASQIQSLSQPHTVADLPAALTLVEEAVTSDASSSKFHEPTQVYFFSDLQRTTWKAAGTQTEHAKDEAFPRSSVDGNSVRERLSALARRAKVTIVDVGQGGASNLAVTRLATTDPFVVTDQETSLEVSLRQFGQEPVPQCSVELSVDDVPVGEQTVNLPAGGEATARFMHRFNSPGRHTVAARAASDRLDVDNRRWLVVPVREEVRVLCVVGRDNAAKYLVDALNPNPTAPSAIRPAIVSEGDLAETGLADFACVFLCNMAQITPNEAQRLARYAAGGGGVVLFLGDRVVPDSYNAVALGGEPAAERSPEALEDYAARGLLLPARIGELMTQPQFGLDPLDYRHPIVAPFRGRERAGLLTTPVTRYYRLDVSQSPRDIEVAAATHGGDPFIVTAPLGQGRVVLVATDGSISSVDPATGEPWTNWPTWPSFLPLVREMLAYALGGQEQTWQQRVGSSLGGALSTARPLSSAGSDHRLQVMRPDGRADPVSQQSVGRNPQWSYGETDLSGVYTVRGLPQKGPALFAVNVDPSESDLAQADPAQLPSNLAVRTTWQDAEGGGRSSLLTTAAAWSSSLLWLAFALLFLESFLAWQFGRGAT